MTADGYPDEAEVAKVRAWPWQDYSGMQAFVKGLWAYDNWGWHEEGYEDRSAIARRYMIPTAGGQATRT